MQNQETQIVLADAHNCSRIGLVQVLMDADFEIVAEATNLEECLRLLAKHQPPLLLLACNLLPPEPLSFIRTVRQAQPHCHIVLYLANCDDLPLSTLVEAGVKRMVTNKEPTSTLLQVIQSAATGQDAYSPQVMAKLMQADSSSSPPLTEFEEKLLQLVCAEKNNAEMAAALNTSTKTVERRLTVLYAKLHVEGRVGAAVWFTQCQNRGNYQKNEGTASKS